MNTNFKTNLTLHCRNRLATFFKYELLKEKSSKITNVKKIEGNAKKHKDRRKKASI